MIKTKYLFFIFILWLHINIYGENLPNFSCIFMDTEYTGKIDVYCTPGGKIITSVKHDFKNENFIEFSILQKNDSMFQVSAFYSLNEDSIIATGWIKKNDKLGIFTRGYGDLILYKSPNNKEKIIVPENSVYSIDMWIVTDSQGEWLKVKATVNGKKYEGWLSPDMQCCNVYSTCS